MDEMTKCLIQLEKTTGVLVAKVDSLDKVINNGLVLTVKRLELKEECWDEAAHFVGGHKEAAIRSDAETAQFKKFVKPITSILQGLVGGAGLAIVYKLLKMNWPGL